MLNRVKLLNRTAAVALLLAAGAGRANADAYSTAILADNPIAFWQLNETTGTVAHDSAGTFNGTYINVSIDQPGYNTGADPGALSVGFGPSPDSYVGGIPLDLATNANGIFSAEAWVNGAGQATSAGIFGKGTGGGGEQFYLDCGGTGGAIRFFVRNAAGTVSAATSTVQLDGNWHYLAGVCDEVNGVVYLYIDGQRVASGTISGGIHASTNPNMNIGARQSSTGSYDDQFSGDISDVAVYHYALSPTQILNHYYAAGIPPQITQEPPISSLTTNEGSAVTITAAASGSPVLSLQWYVNSTPVPGQTNAVFSVTNISSSLNGGLYLSASNQYGTANSLTVSLTVNSGAPQIISVFPAELDLYLGETFTYSVVAQGTVPFTYQWLENGFPINGATNSSYTATSTSGTNTYQVNVSNNAGGGSTTPSTPVVIVGVLLPSGTYANTVLADHPVAYWRLDDATNATTASEFAGGHIGTYNSVQLGVPGYSPTRDPDTAAAFGVLATTDSYMAENDNSAAGVPLLDFSAPVNSNAQFSVEAWVNGPAGQNSAGSAIVAKGVAGADEFVLDASAPGGNFRFYTRKPGGSTSAIFGSGAPDGHWHHLVAVCDEVHGTTSLYVDGAIAGQITGLGGSGLYATTTPISVGAQSNGADYVNQFNGTIDEVSVYNYALSQAQVTSHYNAAPLPPYFTSEPPTNILAYLGQPETLSAAVLGSAPLSLQWYSNSVALSAQTNISLNLNTSHTGTNTYTLIVTNAYGNVSSAGTVVQIPAGSGPPQLLSDITPGTGSRYANLPLTYSVTASGSAPLIYRWFFNNAVIPGATNSAYAIASLQASNQGSYYCLVSNSINTIASSTSVLTVIPQPPAAYPRLIIADHPVAYFRLDEAVGSANGFDYVGGNVGQYTALQQSQLPLLGVPGYNPTLDTNTACKFGIGGGSVFDNYLGNTITNIDFAVPNGQNGAFSLEAWVNGNSGVSQDGGACIVAKGQGGAEQFAMDCNGGFRFYVRNAASATLVNAQAAPTLGGALVSGSWQMDGHWHHVVGVCDQINSNLLLYVDGQLIGPNIITNGVVPKLAYAYDIGHAGTGTNGVIGAGVGINETTITTANENSVAIGNRNKNSGHVDPGGAYDLPFQGVLDDVALYNYALTPTQVLNHYNVATGTVARVPLIITYAGGHVVISWTGPGALESATTATGSWSTVVGASSPYTNSSPTGQLYYRLKIN